MFSREARSEVPLNMAEPCKQNYPGPSTTSRLLVGAEPDPAFK